MPNLRDEDRVELALVPALLQGLVHCIASRAGTTAADGSQLEQHVVAHEADLKAVLKTAADAPLADLPDKRQRNLHRRVTKLAAAGTAELDQQSGIKIGLVFYYFVEGLLRSEWLVLYEDTDLCRVLNGMVEQMGPAFGQPRLDASAQRQARRLLVAFQGLGYLKGVQLEQVAA